MSIQLKPGTWADAESYLNREFPMVKGADPVEWSAVRRRLEVLEWDCPLHLDEATAAGAGHSGIPAPATMLATFGMTPYWQPGDPPEQPGDPPKSVPVLATQLPGPGDSLFATNVETEHYLPVCVGDWLTSTSKLIDITYKRTQVGEGAFMTTETTYFNQRNAKVGVFRLTVFRYTAER